MNDIYMQIANYHVKWYIYPILFTPLAILFFIAISKKISAHAKTVRDKILFFIAPYLPERMIIIGNKIYYDNEIEIIKGEKGYYLQSVYGEHYTAEVDPDEIAVVRSAFSARGPEGVPSPFSLAWRWAIASVILVYGTALGFLSSYFDPRFNAIKILRILGYNIPNNIATSVLIERSQNMAFSVLIFSIALAWWIANLRRLSSNSIKVSSYVPLSISNATIYIIPAVAPDSPASVFKIINKIIRNGIVLQLTDDALEKLHVLADKLKLDKASIVQLLNQASMADLWRRTLGNKLEDYQDIKESAVAECMLKNRDLRPSIVTNFAKIVLVIAIATAIISGFIGYVLGSVYGAPHIMHYNNTSSYNNGFSHSGGWGAHTPQPVPGGGSNYNNNITIHPAPPPTPPIPQK